MENIFQEFFNKITNEEQSRKLDEILEWIKKNYPKLKPEYKWNQPMFTDHGTYIIGFSVAKNHLAIGLEAFTISVLSETIKSHGFEHSKMIVKLPWDKPTDYTLLKKIIKYNISVKQNINTFWYQ